MPFSVSTYLARAVERVARTRPAQVQWSGGVASFTFDDFPRSALRIGGALLEKHGVRGTYYASLNLAGTESRLGPMFDQEDLRAARESGHEIACHTYSHVDCGRTPVGTVIADVDANTAAFKALLPDFAARNFAFPFGEVSHGAKRALAPRFASCRGTRSAINSGRVDLADLNAWALYARNFDDARIRDLIDRSHAIDGWLIFYTHDVAASPSPYGCTPAQLDAVIAYAAERIEILPVQDVLGRLGYDGTAMEAAA